MADALSRKSYDTLACMRRLPKELFREFESLDLIIINGKIASLEVRPLILNDIKEAQEEDEYLKRAKKQGKETQTGGVYGLARRHSKV